MLHLLFKWMNILFNKEKHVPIYNNPETYSTMDIPNGYIMPVFGIYWEYIKNIKYRDAVNLE